MAGLVREDAEFLRSRRVGEVAMAGFLTVRVTRMSGRV